MDETLLSLLRALEGDDVKSAATVEFADEDTVEIVSRDCRQRHKLKPLQQLYGADHGATVSKDDDRFLPLLHCFEEQIVYCDENAQPLTDGAVLLTLQRLSLNPEDPSSDLLAQNIQRGLRLTLSLNDYSRQNVRQAARTVAKSVERHAAGGRGYLEFIREFLRPH